MIAALFFYLFAGLCVASAFMVIASKNPVHSVLYLILAFVNASGLFVLMGAEFLARLGGELEVRSLDDGVHRAGLLAQAAVDALHHVDVVARRAACAVVAPRPRLDGDGLRRTDRLAELARDAALLAVRVAAQRVLAAKTRAHRPFPEGIVERRLLAEEIAE